MSRMLAIEWASRGIRVNAVAALMANRAEPRGKERAEDDGQQREQAHPEIDLVERFRDRADQVRDLGGAECRPQRSCHQAIDRARRFWRIAMHGQIEDGPE